MGLINSKTAILCLLGLLATTTTAAPAKSVKFVDLLIGDFDGDGQADFIRRQIADSDSTDTDPLAKLFLATESCDKFDAVHLSATLGLRPDFNNAYVGDFNGDGLADILRQEKGAWANNESNTAFLLLATGKGTFKKIVLPEDYALKGDLTNIFVGDFDGDGNDDFLRQEKGAWDDDTANTAQLFLSKGNGKFKKIALPEDYALKGDLTNIFVGDFNGDGKADFIRQEKGAWDDDNANTAQLFLSNGNGKFKKISLPEDYALKGDLTNIFVGDFNGDGKDDFLRQEKGAWDDDSVNTAHVFLSTGNKGQFKQIALPEDYALKGDLTNIYIGDFNGDGRDDFLRQEKGAWDDDKANTAQVFLSTGGQGKFDKVALPESWNLKGDKTALYVGDFNGDGKDDFIRHETGSVSHQKKDDISLDLFVSSGKKGSFNRMEL